MEKKTEDIVKLGGAALVGAAIGYFGHDMVKGTTGEPAWAKEALNNLNMSVEILESPITMQFVFANKYVKKDGRNAENAIYLVLGKSGDTMHFAGLVNFHYTGDNLQVAIYGRKISADYMGTPIPPDTRTALYVLNI